MEKDYKYLVATRCMTYNQAAYIEDTLRGFTIQEVNFPVVYIITDDASTDGEPMVLRKWADENLEVKDGEHLWKEMPYGQLAVANLKYKPLLTFVLLLLTENHYTPDKLPLKLIYISEWERNAKYLAFCEGDDYWIAPQKLKKEIDVLEFNPSVTLVCTSFKTVDEKGNEIIRPYFEDVKKRSKSGETLRLLFRDNFVMTLTTCMRQFLVETDLYTNCPTRLDLSFALVAAMYGDIIFLQEETACYRKVATSIINTHHEKILARACIIRGYYSKRYLNKRYKDVTFLDDRRIIYSIANTCIADRNWALFKEIHKKPYFLLVFVVVFLIRSVRKVCRFIVPSNRCSHRN